MARRSAAELAEQGALAERAASVAFLLRKVAWVDQQVALGRLPEEEGKPLRRRLRLAAEQVEQGLHL